MAVLEYQKRDTKVGVKCISMGDSWQLRGLFSSIKRIFGETVRAASPEGTISDVKKAFILYNILISI